MALMDKMKAQAAQLAQKAQEAGKAGQSKIEDVQARRRADGLLRDLGAVVYAQHSGNATGDSTGEIDRIVAELKKLESEQGPLASSGASGSTTDTTTTATDEETPPEGGFTL
jgi:hypothetical protein